MTQVLLLLVISLSLCRSLKRRFSGDRNLILRGRLFRVRTGTDTNALAARDPEWVSFGTNSDAYHHNGERRRKWRAQQRNHILLPSLRTALAHDSLRCRQAPAAIKDADFSRNPAHFESHQLKRATVGVHLDLPARSNDGFCLALGMASWSGPWWASASASADTPAILQVPAEMRFLGASPPIPNTRDVAAIVALLSRVGLFWTLAMSFALSLLSPIPLFAQKVPWAREFYDPAAENGDPADLVLPMPCGGGFALQKVEVPVDGSSLLADRRLRLGSSDQAAGFASYAHNAYLRGGFNLTEEASSFFFLSRYELTKDQARAIFGDCPASPTPQGRVPALGLSWFDAVDLARRYTEWLREHAPEHLPSEGVAPGFLRLPTEAEWEYAARGGAAVNPAVFAAALYPMEGGIDAHAWHQSVSRGSARPVGVRSPNPLGLFDIYGNAEELILVPFKAIAAGRRHGQVGGLVTRGGSYLTAAEQMSSAKRNEWPMYGASDGRASAADTFGARFLLSVHLAVDDQRLAALDAAWNVIVDSDSPEVEDPLGALDIMISEELDQNRLAVLNSLRQMMVRQRSNARELQLETLRANLANGAVLVAIIRQTTRNIARFERVRKEAEAGLRVFSDGSRKEELEGYLAFADRELSDLIPTRADALQSYGRSLHSLSILAGSDELTDAYDRLQVELRASGQSHIQELASDFLSDVASFSVSPPTNMGALIDLALKR